MRIAVISAFIILVTGLIINNIKIIEIGILALIATPLLRVLVSILSFLIAKDYLYVLITILVLLILLLSVFIGLNF